MRVFATLLLTLSFATAATAVETTYTLLNHPNGGVNPPPYGLHLQNIAGPGDFTFDFEYVDGPDMADVKLTYDSVAATVRIYGRCYGGRDDGPAWDATLQGWMDIDFLYTMNVIQAHNELGSPGNDLYVTDQHPANAGTFSLDGWGGDAVLTAQDLTSGDFSFGFDNDRDWKGNQDIRNNPMLWSGTGWLELDGITASSHHDWLFIAEGDAPTPVDPATWAEIKASWR